MERACILFATIQDADGVWHLHISETKNDGAIRRVDHYDNINMDTIGKVEAEAEDYLSMWLWVNLHPEHRSVLSLG